MWHLLDAVKGPDIVKGVDAWREAAVKAEDLVVDECGKREVVEEVGEMLPYVGIAIFAEALVVETVNLGDLAGLVVSSEDSDALWVADLKGNKEGDGLDGVVSTVDIVSCKHLLASDHGRGAQAQTYP